MRQGGVRPKCPGVRSRETRTQKSSYAGISGLAKMLSSESLRPRVRSASVSASAPGSPLKLEALLSQLSGFQNTTVSPRTPLKGILWGKSVGTFACHAIPSPLHASHPPSRVTIHPNHHSKRHSCPPTQTGLQSPGLDRLPKPPILVPIWGLSNRRWMK